MYVQLCTQKDLDCAGLLTLNLTVLAKGCNGIDEAAILADLTELEAGRFVFVDYDTDELFVRARMRWLGVAKSANFLKSALRSARSVESPKLRREVASELRRLGQDLAYDVAEELNPSEPPANPLRTPPTPTPSLTTSRGACARASERPVCKKHPENHDGPCVACRRRREWDEANAAIIAESELHQRRALKVARQECPYCDQNGMVETPNGLARCTAHSEAL